MKKRFSISEQYRDFRIGYRRQVQLAIEFFFTLVYIKEFAWVRPPQYKRMLRAGLWTNVPNILFIVHALVTGEFIAVWVFIIIFIFNMAVVSLQANLTYRDHVCWSSFAGVTVKTELLKVEETGGVNVKELFAKLNYCHENFRFGTWGFRDPSYMFKLLSTANEDGFTYHDIFYYISQGRNEGEFVFLRKKDAMQFKLAWA